ncbi:ribosome maturation factor RimP [Clostridium sp. P21]|uniref:Ribosome maturation factor RimP n=1 Tax=Clostridium muellerianum TaxID=2716538 RepID=A0A7Y0ELK9_9CLOT|nr:ribosome maturation factor RimP [Clostridium muellerianum]NMM65690.1 ribosome maturation factor RimP [Clostridium muellerianum]
MNKSTLINRVEELIKPIVVELNYELYYLELVREGKDNYLRIYIDKENGTISLEDCEKVSRAVSDMLDVEDPIREGYYLEVSSPGIERILHTDEHLQKYIGNDVLAQISGLLNGKKKYEGTLVSFNNEELNIETKEKEEISIPREKILNVSLKGKF